MDRLETPKETLALLKSLGASQHLIRHLELVGEAGDELIEGLKTIGVPFDSDFVRLGISIHDAGKIVHPEEMSGKGSDHEPAGEALLLQHGVPASVARCCLSHARFATMDVSFEELLIALADKLWKGKRLAELELRVIDAAATRLKKERWDVFSELDTCFETIASKGDQRLERSRT